MNARDARLLVVSALLAALVCAPVAANDATSTEASSTDATSTEPASTEPSSTEPSSAEPSSTEPSSTEPASTEPASTEPSSTEPSTTEPASTGPASSDGSSDADVTPVGASPWAEGLDAEFGKGVTLTSPDGRFSLTTRGRVQFRAAASYDDADVDEEEPVDLFLQIRRARLVFMGQLFRPDVQFYIQLGVAPSDMEPDLLVPLRDAVLSWTPLRDVGVRVGQMKVPFNRERVISSSALQFTDRSIVNAELTLDRDIGVQLFSNDLLGLGGVLGYQVGVFGGEGRNRLNQGVGLLYVARLQAQPTGRFDDAYSEADLLRTTTPRVSFGAGVAFNHRARRTQGTTGMFYRSATSDDVHAELDLIVKWWGFSLQSELLFRQSLSRAEDFVIDDAPFVELPRSGTGFMVQAGYLLPFDVELAARYAMIEPLVVEAVQRVDTAMPRRKEATVAVGYYVIDHNLKVQGEATRLFAEDVRTGTTLGRVQVQVFF